jgi:hypothetical protein
MGTIVNQGTTDSQDPERPAAATRKVQARRPHPLPAPWPLRPLRVGLSPTGGMARKNSASNP